MGSSLPFSCPQPAGGKRIPLSWNAPFLQLLCNSLAPRLLTYGAVGGIIGTLSFEHDETFAHPVLGPLCGSQRGRNSRNEPHSGPVAHTRRRQIHVAADAQLTIEGEAALQSARTLVRAA